MEGYRKGEMKAVYKQYAIHDLATEALLCRFIDNRYELDFVCQAFDIADACRPQQIGWSYGCDLGSSTIREHRDSTWQHDRCGHFVTQCLGCGLPVAHIINAAFRAQVNALRLKRRLEVLYVQNPKFMALRSLSQSGVDFVRTSEGILGLGHTMSPSADKKLR